MASRCGREFGRLDNGNDQTPRKLSEWRKQLYSRMMRDEVPFAPSVQTLTCEVNVQQNITEIPRLITDKEQFEHVNLLQTTSVSFGRCVHWNNRFEAARSDCRLRSLPCLGKRSSGQKRLNQYSVTEKMRSVRFDVAQLAERGLHRKASRNSSMSSHAGRSHSPTSRVPNRSDENGVRGSVEHREVRGQTRTDVSDSRRPGPQNETRGDGTLWHRRLQFITTLETSSSEVRQHRTRRNVSWHSVEQT